MKHYMQPRSAVLREVHAADLPSNSPNPKSSSSKGRSSSRKQKSSKENAPPPDLNALPSPSPSKMKPPRPPPSNPLKRKLNMETVLENAVAGGSDSGVKVIVRMRPPRKDEEDGEVIVQKTSADSLTINGQTFTFDSVADVESTQLDIFQLVGAPLVENCLAGFNSSVFAYGQTGSGKTYTIWGPANALLDENLSSDQQGLTPRVFQRLFARINEEQTKHSAKQLKYQCRCSFLEIYNEQITDLLDPAQRNLQIREDVKSGTVYVEDLKEESVSTMKDVTQLLIKGLSNRRTGATSINAESSRSHSVFTCVVESRCKSTADGVGIFKTSRINLVDLAGSERQKLTGAAGERLKEAGNINRSLSQLGNLINILAEVSQTGKQRHIPYRDSRLTFLLQESLGGNAKLAMVCAVSPVQSCRSETFSTLRFAQRAKAIKNKAVVNEIMPDDVNSLREVIKQLKDELLQLKGNGNKPNDSLGGFARRSLNLLKLSFNRPMTLPRVDDDGDEEMEIVEEAVEKVGPSVGSCSTNCEGKKDGSSVEPQFKTTDGKCTPQISEDTDVNMEEEGVSEHIEKNEVISEHIEKNEVMILDCAEPIRSIPDCTSDNALNHGYIAEPIFDTVDGDSYSEQIGKREFVSTSFSKLSNKEHPSRMVSSYPVVSKHVSGVTDSSRMVSSYPVVSKHVSGVTDSSRMVSSYPVVSKHVSGVTNDVSLSIVPFDSSNVSANNTSPSNLSIDPCDVSPSLTSPTPSVSPRISTSRKSLRTSSMLSASQKDLKDETELGTEAVHKSSMKSSTHGSSVDRPTHRNTTAEHLAASLHRGLEIIDSHRQSSPLARSLFRFSYKPSESKLILPVQKIDVGVQAFFEDTEVAKEDTMEILCSTCKRKAQLEVNVTDDSSNLQLVPVEGSESTEKTKKLVPKAVEKVLAGSFRREMALEEFCARQNSEIIQLKRLVQQYKHERECNAIMGQTRENKILRLESLMDGVLPTDEYMEEEFMALTNEHKLLKEKYENHPEVLMTKIELKRVQDELESYRSFFDMGEREVLLEEIQDLRSQLQSYVDSTSVSARKRNPILQLTYSCDPSLAPPLSKIPESGLESAEERIEQERVLWTEIESKWISVSEELRRELDAARSATEKQKQELNTEKKCAEELKEALQLAMEGHARMLEQYADLEEKHMQLLARHRKIRDGIDDVKKAASKAGVRGAESKFINALAAEISALRAEKEKERRYLRDENKGLQAQLRDTAEAVQAAGELLVRLKEAEEAVASAQKHAMEAEEETERAYKEIENLRVQHEREVSTLNQLLAESRLPAAALRPTCHDSELPKYDTAELESLCNSEDGELLKLAEPSSWFSGYDRCNI